MLLNASAVAVAKAKYYVTQLISQKNASLKLTLRLFMRRCLESFFPFLGLSIGYLVKTQQTQPDTIVNGSIRIQD